VGRRVPVVRDDMHDFGVLIGLGRYKDGNTPVVCGEGTVSYTSDWPSIRILMT
jgi:hypothetical protein